MASGLFSSVPAGVFPLSAADAISWHGMVVTLALSVPCSGAYEIFAWAQALVRVRCARQPQPEPFPHRVPVAGMGGQFKHDIHDLLRGASHAQKAAFFQ